MAEGKSGLPREGAAGHVGSEGAWEGRSCLGAGARWAVASLVSAKQQGQRQKGPGVCREQERSAGPSGHWVEIA